LTPGFDGGRQKPYDENVFRNGKTAPADRRGYACTKSTGGADVYAAHAPNRNIFGGGSIRIKRFAFGGGRAKRQNPSTL